LIINKTDLKNSLDSDEFRRLGIKEIIRSSAEHNRGITDILEMIIHNIPKKNLKINEN